MLPTPQPRALDGAGSRTVAPGTVRARRPMPASDAGVLHVSWPAPPLWGRCRARLAAPARWTRAATGGQCRRASPAWHRVKGSRRPAAAAA